VTAASFTLHAGPRAARWVAERGLAPEHIACIPAAAGGPKGLALIPLDQRLFGGWLGDAQPERIGGRAFGIGTDEFDGLGRITGPQ
jgi:hypothetical protein